MDIRLKKKITADIKSCGHTLTFDISNILEKIGWSPSISSRFLDDATNRVREIDIVASKVFDVKYDDEKDIAFVVKLVIETKNNKNKPWIIFSTKEESIDKEIRAAWRFNIQSSEGMFGGGEASDMMSMLPTGNPYFDREDVVVFSTLKGRGVDSGGDDFFNSTSSVIKTIRYSKEKEVEFLPFDTITWYIPIVVTSNNFFIIPSTVDINNDKQIEESINEQSFCLARIKYLEPLKLSSTYYRFPEPTEGGEERMQSVDNYICLVSKKEFEKLIMYIERDARSIHENLKKYFHERHLRSPKRT